MFGLHGRFVAQLGQGDALEAILLEAAEALGEREGCRLYLVSRSPVEPESVWVTESGGVGRSTSARSTTRE